MKRISMGADVSRARGAGREPSLTVGLPVRTGSACACVARAFTLIELLVVIAVIALLLGILLPSLSGAKKAAVAVQASVASRTLMQAYVMYAGDQRGWVLPGHLEAGQAKGLVDEFGNAIGDPVAQRWVYRLGPWFDHGWAGTTHIGTRKEVLKSFRSVASTGDLFMWSYEISVFPSFGLNAKHVGGDYRDAAATKRGRHVKRIEDAHRPGGLIVFASARFNVPPMKVDGYVDVEPPPAGAVYREEDTTAAPATAFGRVHARYGRKVMVGCLDGHAEAIAPEKVAERWRWVDRE